MSEIDIRNVDDEPSRVATLSNLRLISRERVEAGRLDSAAELVFTGGLVREALERLLSEPNAKFRALVEQAVGQPIDKERLDRLLGHFSVVQKSQYVQAKPTKLGGSAPFPLGSEGPDPNSSPVGSSTTYDRDHHVKGKPKAIVELFNQLDERGRHVGDGTVGYTKMYVNYSRGKRSFMTVELFRDKMKVHLTIPWDQAPQGPTRSDARRNQGWSLRDGRHGVRVVEPGSA